MNIKKLCSFTNDAYIISEHLRDLEMYNYMDIVIDDINDTLQSKFPLISEWKDYVAVYNVVHAEDEEFVPLDPDRYSVIPARYLRSVVAIGAALNFFTNDEEGEQIANKYYIQYERNKFNMLRDFHELIPEEYQNIEGGFVTNSYNAQEDWNASIEGIVMQNGSYTDVF